MSMSEIEKGLREANHHYAGVETDAHTLMEDSDPAHIILSQLVTPLEQASKQEAGMRGLLTSVVRLGQMACSDQQEADDAVQAVTSGAPEKSVLGIIRGKSQDATTMLGEQSAAMQSLDVVCRNTDEFATALETVQRLLPEMLTALHTLGDEFELVHSHAADLVEDIRGYLGPNAPQP